MISWKLDVFEVGSWISLDVAVDETFGRGYKAFGLDSWDLDSQSITWVWASSIGAGVVSAPHGPSFPSLEVSDDGTGHRFHQFYWKVYEASGPHLASRTTENPSSKFWHP